MDTRLLPPPPEPAPKSGTAVEWHRWLEVDDETGQIADQIECLADIYTALTELRNLVQKSPISLCDADKKKWLFNQLGHINKHVRTPLETMRADMWLKNN